MSTYCCIALIRVLRSIPRGVLALLKQAIVGATPWLKAPNAFLVWLDWLTLFLFRFVRVEMILTPASLKLSFNPGACVLRLC